MRATCGLAGLEGKAESLRATAKDAPKQFEAYKSDCIEALNPFEPGKSLDSATSAHDFDFKILKHEPTTVYLMAPSEKLAVAAPWISLIISHIIETVAREVGRSEEHTSELQLLMSNSYAVFCLKKKNHKTQKNNY